jgi:hypothetical protein
MRLGGLWIFKEEHVAVGAHVVCAIYLNKGKPETYVSHWYMMDTYRKSYASGISPMPSPDEWPVDEGVEPIEPP